jgi:HlyD family secretion protein
MIRDTSAQDRVIAAPATARSPKRLLLIAAAALALIVVSWSVYAWLAAERSVDGARLRFAEVRRGELTRDVLANGRVVAANSPNLYAPAAGTVKLETRAGATVQRGDVLAVIDSPELDSELERERAILARVDAETSRARIESERNRLNARKAADEAEVARLAAVRDLERSERGFEKGAIAEIDYLRAKDALQAAEIRAKHAAADSELNVDAVGFEQRTREQELRRQRAVVADLERRYEELTVRAPVDGIVGTINVVDRAMIARDAPLMVVVDLSRLEVEIEVPESFADELGIGMPVELTLPNGKSTGTLASVSPEITGANVLARVRFDDAEPQGLRQNQRVQARVLIEHKPDVLLVQRGPFFDEDGGRYAFVVRDGIAQRRPVKFGATSLEAIEILDGLQPGERIVIAGTDAFEDAERIRVGN